MPIASADDVAQVIEALADLLWPVLAFVALLMFKSELTAMAKRARRVRTPGGVEIDLDKELDELQASATEAEEATPPIPAATPTTVELGTGEEHDEALPITAKTGGGEDEAERMILERAADSPRAALMLLSAEIERKAREVLSTRAPDAAGAPFHRQMELLDVSPAVRRAATEFRDVRNRIVHGGVASDDETFRAIDAGTSILRAVSRIPHELNFVIEAKVDCFADADGEQQHDFQAVLLGSEHPPTGDFQKRAFPHTGPPLPRGEPVTWEWKSGERVFPEAWYRDPETLELVYGWTSSLEFAGQPLHPGPRPVD